MNTNYSSTYDLLLDLCSKSEIRVRFDQRYSTELYPDFFDLETKLQETLNTPISIWFTSGDGQCIWSSVDLVFTIFDNELCVCSENEEIDTEYFSENEESDYLLDVNKLRDSYIHSIRL